MRPVDPERDPTAVWKVECPTRPSRMPGVRMAGFRDNGTGLAAAGHRVVPHPDVTLFLEFGARAPLMEDTAGRQRRESLLAGPGLGSGGALWVRGEDLECVQVRLSPPVAGVVLGVSPGDLDGAPVPVEDLWGREAARIRERLSEAATWGERFALTDALLARRYDEAARRSRSADSAVDPEVAWAWHRIVAGHGLIRVDALAAEVGWSRKRLWARFHAQIGLPPKRAATLVRFDHAAHLLTAGEPAARVAADAGFADQSHLHRDVMAFAGVTPTAVAGEPWLTVDDLAWPNGGASSESPARPGRTDPG
ncbi:araC family transcriptional regulator [Streptomyces laurentii]|uniref:AraC family transcriptional regulator n=1 Tax=Streptomyces laurentii TaxID=39478 RepID=A0A161JGX3_STRLU|nr:araC family transcriptional regulator [Streptomyces laurentii]